MPTTLKYTVTGLYTKCRFQLPCWYSALQTWSTALWYVKAYISVAAWYTFVRNVYCSAADVCNVWCEIVFNWWWDIAGR